MTKEGLTDVRKNRILELIDQGYSFDEIATELMPKDESEIMRRVALFRRIDADAFDCIWPTTDTHATKQLESLRASDYLAVGTGGIFSVRDKLSGTFIKHWDVQMDSKAEKCSGIDATSFLDMHQKLADHFKGRGRGFELEHLHHLLPANPEAGIRRMEELLRERLPQPDETTQGATDATLESARDGVAIASAFDVLGVVDKQLAYVPENIKDTYTSARRQAEAWSYWCDAWYRTRRYIPRQRIHAWFDKLHSADGTRILEIHAPGGSGKTMSLRWLITHHCIPRRKPIAHLDFDHFIGTPQEPWQLLLRCAEQLDRQLAGAPFTTLILDGQAWESTLQGNPSSTHLNVDPIKIKNFSEDFPRRFGNLLTSASNSIVTIIVDTFEEAMVHDLTPVAPFIAWLVRFAQQCPHVRLIICGRFSLEHRNFGATLKEDYPAEYAFYEKYLSRQRFPQFDETEFNIFLSKRDVNLDEELRTKLFESFGTIVDNPPKPPEREVSPFDLSLVADLLKNGEVDPRHLLFQGKGTIGVIYLIERVIARIKDAGVRWLLRYGVVPRQLTKEFFNEVIVPHLKSICAGRSEEDNPIDDPLPPDLYEKGIYFKESPILDNQKQKDDIWNSLCLYAGVDSWIETHGSDTMIFNARAREPMRALLRQHTVLRSIHRDAAAYFEKKAGLASAPGSQIACLREAIYHRFQLDGQEAGDYWKKLLDDCLTKEDFEVCFSIVQEINGEEYGPNDKGPLIDSETLMDAYFKQGLAAIDLADLSDNNKLQWREWLRKAVAVHQQILSMNLDGFVAWGRMLELMINIRKPLETNYDRAELRKDCQNLNSLMGDANSIPGLNARVYRSLAIGQDRLSDCQCVVTYARLLRERLDAPSTIVQNPMTVFLIQSLAKSTVDYGGSMLDFKLLSTVGAVNFSGKLQDKLTQSLAHTLASFMRAESAKYFVEEQGIEGIPEVDLLRIEGIARTYPQKALKLISEFRAMYGGSKHALARASSLKVDAWTCSMLCDIYATSAALADAGGLFMKAGEPAEAAGFIISEAAFWLHLHGNFSRARKVLAKRKRSLYGISKRDDPDTWPEKLLELKIDMQSKDPPTVHYFSSLIHEAKKSSRLYDQVNCAMTLFSVLEPPELDKFCNQLAKLLIHAFEQMPDSLARTNYPWLLRDIRQRIKLKPELEERLVRLVSIPDPPALLFGREAGPSDQAWAALAHGYLLGFIGRLDKAVEMADLAERHFSRINSLTGLREVWHLNAKCGRSVPAADDLEAYRGQAIYLYFVVSVEQAEHSIERNDIDSAKQWMQRVDLKRLYELPTHFAPRAMVVQARLAQAGAKGESVETLLLRAEKAYESLADHLNAAQCRAKLYGLRKGTITNIHSFGSEWKSQITADKGDIPDHDDAEKAWPLFPRQVLSLSETPTWINALGEFGGVVSASSLREKILLQHETAPYELVEAAAKHPNLLAGPVFERLASTESLLGSPCDLAISADALAGAGIPWELARLNHDAWTAHNWRLIYRTVISSDYRIQWLQRTLRETVNSSLAVDGLWGPQTATALRSFRQQTGTEDARKLKRELGSKFRQQRKAQEPPLAIILQSTTERQKVSQRGIQFAGSMLPRLYDKLGFRSQIFFGLDLPGFFSEWQHRAPPVLIHIYAPYMDSPTLGGVLPDFGDVYTQHSKSRAGNAGERPSEFRVPLLILDGPAELEPTEHMRQIFLRNASATLLAQDTSFPNILGLGLDHHLDLSAMEKLLAAIVQGINFREIYFNLVEDGKVQEAAGLSMDNLFQSTGKLSPALWSADPDLPILL